MTDVAITQLTELGPAVLVFGVVIMTVRLRTRFGGEAGKNVRLALRRNQNLAYQPRSRFYCLATSYVGIRLDQRARSEDREEATSVCDRMSRG